MKKIFAFVSVCLFAFAVYAVEPAKITITNFRGEAESAASSDIFYRSDTILFTNCVVYSGTTTNSSKEDLTGLTVNLTWGDGVLTSSSTNANISSTAGVWNATITLRSNEGLKTYFQVRLTNSTSVFTYPFKYINVKAKL
jgi:hypothetical protein